MDVKAMQELVQIDEEISDLQGKLSRLKERRGQLEPHIMQDLIDNNIDKITMNGRTIYIHTRYFAKISSKTNAIKALKEAGFDEYINEGYNTTSLNALIAEMVRGETPMPPEFGDAIKPDSKLTIRSTKA